MQKVLALLLISALTVPSAFAGLNRNKAKYVGGTTTAPPVQSMGILSATDEDHLTFNYERGKAADKTNFPAGDFRLPYSEITAISYGQHASWPMTGCKTSRSPRSFRLLHAWSRCGEGGSSSWAWKVC